VYFANFAVTQDLMTAIEELRQTVARLRAPDGCPWDIEQTHQTLARCLIDECSELLDTIDRNDIPHMREELGDVLIQVVFHAQIADERGDFNLDDVIREINEKLIRRHPHVFGTGKLDTSEQVLVQWEQIKALEKAAAGKSESRLFKALPPRLPALMFAEDVAKRIEKKQLPADGVVDAARVKALGVTLDESALGRMLFEIAAAARVNGLDPEGALRKECDRVMLEVEARVDAGLRTAAKSD
jgi:XTP/dITP diphosphohydrolase/tetrapyrrole methylase family protein/MazG family protein